MNQAQILTTVFLAATCLTAGSLRAQRDRIVFVDGKSVEKVSVTEFNIREIKWRGRSGTDARSTDRVAMVEVQRVKDTYRRAYASARSADGPGNFLLQAESLKGKDAFLAQFGYVEAARLFIDNGQYSDGFQVLEALQKDCPDSAYLPMLYQSKLDYYIGRGKAKDAASVAAKYSTATQTLGYPRGFAVEAEYYKAMADAVAGSMSGDQLRNVMRQIQQKATEFPHVADRARLQIANAARQEGKTADAMREYEDLLERENSSDEIRAGAWLGVGQIKFKEGDPTNKQPYYDAMLAFLRVYVETPKAAPAIVAESLHMASEAANKWNGPDSNRMSRKLRSLLLREFPDSPWSKR